MVYKGLRVICGKSLENNKIQEGEQMECDINNNFKYHKPKPGQKREYISIRVKAKELAMLIGETCVSSREKEIALVNLEQSVMWANASIARSAEEMKREEDYEKV